MSDEFAIIASHFAPLSRAAPGALGLTDDAALVTPRMGYELVVTMDTVVVSVHVPADAPPNVIADKLMGSNLSDLAAMGASPIGCTLSCAWGPAVDEPTIAAFAHALSTWTVRYGIPLLGGDTVRTPDSEAFTLTAIGEVPSGQALRRRGAKVGDGVYVSGSVGDGALGLVVVQGGLNELSDEHRTFLRNRYTTPQPRVDLGVQLRGHASACIDVSDGLIQDLGHIARQSDVRIDILRDAIPLSPAARAAVEADPSLWSTVVSGGDDYELAVTAATVPEDIDVMLTRIGTVGGDGPARVILQNANGDEIAIAKSGFRHF